MPGIRGDGGSHPGGTGLSALAVALIVIGLMTAVDGLRGHGYAPPPAPPPAAAGTTGPGQPTRGASPAPSAGPGLPGSPAQPSGSLLSGNQVQPGGPMLPAPRASAGAPVPPGDPVLPGAPVLPVPPVQLTAARSGPAPGPALGYSRPVLLAIPAIRVRARIIPLGAGRDGSARVPPLTEPFLVSWFDKGPAPGQRGTADLFGHVDSRLTGPAVFYRLGLLRPGESISVTRGDHQVAVFRIYSVRMFPKDRFPAAWIYSGTGDAELRLVTCGGPFDNRTRNYLDNTVVFARLAAARGS